MSVPELATTTLFIRRASRLASLPVFLAIALVVLDSGRIGAQESDDAARPSLRETLSWMERVLESRGGVRHVRDTYRQKLRDHPRYYRVDEYTYGDVEFTGCSLTVDYDHYWEDQGDARWSDRYRRWSGQFYRRRQATRWRVTIPFGELRPTVSVRDLDGDSSVQRVRFRTRLGSSGGIGVERRGGELQGFHIADRHWTTIERPARRTEQSDEVTFFFSGAESGTARRFAEAAKHVLELCGTRSDPF